MTDTNEQRYVKSLEGYVKKLEEEIQTYQIVLAMQMNHPEFYEQTNPADESTRALEART